MSSDEKNDYRHNSDACTASASWNVSYWDRLEAMKGKFITKESSSPIPGEVGRLQHKLGFGRGEPLTKYNLHQIIPATVIKRRARHPTNTAPEKTIARSSNRTATPDNPPKRLREKWDIHILKRFVLEKKGKVVSQPIVLLREFTDSDISSRPPCFMNDEELKPCEECSETKIQTHDRESVGQTSLTFF